VIGADLQALQEHDADVKRWLRDDVVPVYDAMQADPARAIHPRRGGICSKSAASQSLHRKDREPVLRLPSCVLSRALLIMYYRA